MHLAQVGHQILLGSRRFQPTPDCLPCARVLTTNWDNDNQLRQTCKNVDIVIHAAGMNANDCDKNPVAALAFNGVATARIVNAASEAGVNQFIYLSTAHVYSHALIGTITEETCPKNLHPYATTHLAGEFSVLAPNKKSDMDAIVLRLSNVFGAPINKKVDCWTLLVNDLCKQAVEKRFLTLRSSGIQHRDFISMSKLCLIIEQLIYDGGGERRNGIFNIGNGVSQSVLEMTEIIQDRCKQILGFQPDILRPSEINNFNCVPLNYDSIYLNNLLAKFNYIDANDEIDDLLRFCKSNFE